MPHRGSTSVLLDPELLGDWAGPDVVLLLGRATGASGAHESFPRWARALELGNVVLRGVDVPADVQPGAWRELVGAMRDNDRVRGAVVTDHRLRLFRACADLLDEQEPTVQLMTGIDGLRFDDGGVSAFARGPLALDAVLHRPPLPVSPSAVVCLGAGTAATALLLATTLDVPATLRDGHPVPGIGSPPLTFVDTDPQALDALLAVLERLPVAPGPVRTVAVPTPEACAEVVAGAPAGSLVVNATGLGSAGPGSPLPDGAAFPPDAVAGDLDGPGPLTFLAQARAAGAAAVDGHDCFVAGWACALAGVFGLDPEEALAAIRAAEPAPDHGAHPQDDAGHVLDGPTPASRS